jgi:hypothetical protein
MKDQSLPQFIAARGFLVMREDDQFFRLLFICFKELATCAQQLLLTGGPLSGGAHWQGDCRGHFTLLDDPDPLFKLMRRINPVLAINGKDTRFPTDLVEVYNEPHGIQLTIRGAYIVYVYKF